MSDLRDTNAPAGAPDDVEDKVDSGHRAEDDDDATKDNRPIPAPFNREEALQRARAHGFPERTAYNYAAYNRDTAKAGGAGAEGAPAGDETAQGPGYTQPAWAANAARYEWNDELGDVAPRIPALERELFKNENVAKAGDHLRNYENFKVKVEGPTIKCITSFDDAGMHPTVLENLELCGYTQVLPIQSFVIPAVLQGYDVIGVAQTGSGKTAAYLIPIISRLMGKNKKLSAPRPNVLSATYNPMTDRVRAEPLVLIVVPTRELAVQIFDETRRLTYRSKFRACVIYGGGPARVQRMELEKGCDILIATPGRLADFMERPNLLSMHRVKYTVLDEADELVQDSWESDRKKIFGGGDVNEDDDHVYLMFSATFSKQHRKLAKEYMADPYVRIRVGRAGSTLPNIKQTIVWVPRERKQHALLSLLFSLQPARTIIFVNGKNEADRVEDFLFNMQLPSTAMHSDRGQLEREDAIRAFKAGSAPILVTTGVSARGLDIASVMHVINWDLPSTQHGGIDEYVHRIGRTGRIGHEGLATSFYNDRNEDIAEDLVRILLESKQEVPDFLEQYKPENPDVLDFDDESDTDDDDEDDEDDGGPVAAPGGGLPAENFAAEESKPAEGGFKADPVAEAAGFTEEAEEW